MGRLSKLQKMNIQLGLGIFLALVGVGLLWTGMFIEPLGEIHPSVLTALGEVFTFSGGLIGIDYTYKYKTIKYFKDTEEDGEYKDNSTHQ